MPKIKNGFFITGTDTNVGKTTIACAILKNLAQRNYKTVALKPLCSGSNDGILLQQYATEYLPYRYVNPFSFYPAIAPHIAAEKINLSLNVPDIFSACQPALNYPADFIIIEGAGGWKVPLNHTETMADLARAFGYPVILVVNIKLGCINHALLSIDSIRRSGLELAGWFANCIEKNIPYASHIIDMIQEYIQVPHLNQNLQNFRIFQNDSMLSSTMLSSRAAPFKNITGQAFSAGSSVLKIHTLTKKNDSSLL